MSTPSGWRNQIVCRGLRGSWAEITPVARPPVLATVVTDHAEAIGAVAAHLAAEPAESLVLPQSRLDSRLRDELLSTGFSMREDGIVTDADPARPATAGRIWLMTSGSTGRPKRVAHQLTGLVAAQEELPANRWLAPYLPGTYSWWSTVALSLHRKGQDVVLVDQSELDSWPQTALREDVTAIAATPTFMRHALLRHHNTLRRLNLAQITLGGEPVSQQLLDQLAEVFPNARLSWVYGMSETGLAIIISGGQAGFPAEWATGHDRIRVEADEIHIRTRHPAEGFDGWVATGDRVQRIGDRLHIVGRTGTDEINVGGSKISRTTIRDVLLAHPCVAWANAEAVTAPLTGQLVGAGVVLTTPVTVADLTAWCSERLPGYGVPRFWTILDEIPITETAKSAV